MDGLRILCPECRMEMVGGYCGHCQQSIKEYEPLLLMVCSGYNRSLRLAKSGDLTAAAAELSSSLPAFPFVHQALSLYYHLSWLGGQQNEAKQALAWLLPFGDTESTQIDLQELSFLPPDELKAHDANYKRITVFPWLPINPYWLLSVSTLLLICVAIAWIVTNNKNNIAETMVNYQRAALAEEVTRNDELAFMNEVYRDSLRIIKRDAGEMLLQLTEVEMQKILMFERFTEGNPHEAYRVLNLANPSGKNRLGDMQMFVKMFPDLDCYTGPFLRELFDWYDVRDSTRAGIYSKQLVEYCLKREGLNSLISKRVLEVYVRENDEY